MLWFLRDYPLAAVLLRAATLAFEALLIGGMFFCTVLLPHAAKEEIFSRRALRLLRLAAVGLAVTQIASIVLDSAMLMSASGLGLVRGLAELATANYFLAGGLVVMTVLLFLVLSRFGFPAQPVWLLFVAPLLAASIWTSHSASRLEHQIPLMIITGLHQLGAAVWIGGMPFLWLLIASFSAEKNDAIVRAVRRYSTTAAVSLVVLIAAGVGMAWFYTRSWSAVYGTGYGVVLLAKSALLVALVLLGAGNFLLIRGGRLHLPPSLLRIARFSEVEIGIGFIIILAAASLTAQSPAIDLMQKRLTLPEIAARMEPQWPRLKTPPISAMPPVQPMSQAMRTYAMLPDDPASANNRVEQAWSEVNHHWAGIIVLIAGILAALGKWDRAKWARNWPLIFLVLAVFLFFRADPEAWPLGPRGFWASFYNPEDLEHRLCILLVASFVAFEWAVETGRLGSRKAALVFPAVCALGGALLLTHNHSLGDWNEGLLTGMTHTAIAIFAVFAGGSRWLEVRAAPGRAKSVAAWIWPVCLMFIGLVLLNYREG